MIRRRLRALERDARVFGQARLAAVGPATARAVEQELGLHVDLCPDAFRAEALADALAERDQIAGRRFLLLHADIARAVLRQRLESGGASHVEDVAIYETVPAASLPQEAIDAIERQEVSWITFTSGSTARNFFQLLPAGLRDRIGSVRIASIGPVTSAALREMGLEPTVQTAQASIAGLIAAIGEGS
jgi:uroporphyrinogen III methyltransferase/synthase